MLGRFALIFFISISCFSKEKLLVKDRALFRIEKQVFFQEAFDTWLSDWNQLKCLGNSSFLLRTLNISANEFKQVTEIIDTADSRPLTEVEKASIEKVLVLVKFILYAQTQAIAEVQLPRTFSCLNDKKVPTIELFILAEVLVRSKFKTTDLKKDKEDQRKAKSFIDSISKSKTHEVYL